MRPSCCLGSAAAAAAAAQGFLLTMAHQRPPPPQLQQLTPLLASPCCTATGTCAEAGGVLGSFLSGIKMVLSILLFLGVCAFTAYVALLCTALLVAALQVLFQTLIPAALLILQFLLSALLLLFCLQWMSEILAQQFRIRDPVL
ncbi:hypothetical protein lerEdw1_019951 [Lerista edwardsae]|nr:hypothetical protein lerEdw1_019951 [Lerista edwardsae]